MRYTNINYTSLSLFKGGIIMTNQYNKDGKKEGLWVKTYDNGRIQEEKNYVNGIREGEYKSYYMNRPCNPR